jgi:hypothetical protein
MKPSRLFPALVIASLVLSACSALGGGGATEETQTESPTALTNTIVQPTVALPPTEAPPTAEPAAEEPDLLVRFANAGESRNNSVVFQLTSYEPPGSGVLVGWLTDDAGTAFKMGVVEAGTETQFQDAEGRDLFGLFSGALVTVEESDAVTEPGVIVLSGTIPPSLLPALREVAVRAATPTGLAFDPGLREQAKILETHGGLLDEAAKANDQIGMRVHAEHVVNIVVGQNNPQYGDLDGNGETANPGDGFGLAEYGNGLISLLDQVLESADSSERRKELAQNMRQCVVNVRNYATDSVGQSQTVLTAPDPASALVNTDQVLQFTRAAYNGFDQNGNGTIEYLPLECGADQAYQLCKPLTAIELKPAGG